MKQAEAAAILLVYTSEYEIGTERDNKGREAGISKLVSKGARVDFDTFLFLFNSLRKR